MSLRVLMTADAIGGVWTYALDLARALRPHDVAVTLATMGTPPSQQQMEDAARVDNVALRVGGYKLEWMQSPWEDVARAADWLLELEHETGADVVHLNGYAHGAAAFRAPKVVVAHSCVMSWWRAVKDEPAPGVEWETYRYLVQEGLAAADIIAAPTAAMLDMLRTEYDFDTVATVIYNGRDAPETMLVDKEPFILCAGRLWDEAKNAAALTAAAEAVRWRVYLAGDAETVSGVQPKSCGVQMLGRLAPGELAAWMARASIYCLPAKYEPFGLSALEAAYCGCALVLGDIPTLREVWGDAACYVNPGDPRALSRQINALIDNPAYINELGRRAVIRARQYRLSKMAQKYMDVYMSLVSSHGRMPGAAACA